MKSTRVYEDFNEFLKNEPEAVKSLIETWAGNIEGDEDKLMTSVWNGKDYDYQPMTQMSELIQDLREWGDSEEEVDSCYITNTYQMSTSDGEFLFEVTGSSYRKDHSICDEEMGDEVTVIDLEMLEAEKAAAKAKAANADREKWDKWFMGKDIHDIKSYLRETKFPSKLK